MPRLIGQNCTLQMFDGGPYVGSFTSGTDLGTVVDGTALNYIIEALSIHIDAKTNVADTHSISSDQESPTPTYSQYSITIEARVPYSGYLDVVEMHTGKIIFEPLTGINTSIYTGIWTSVARDVAGSDPQAQTYVLEGPECP